MTVAGHRPLRAWRRDQLGRRVVALDGNQDNDPDAHLDPGSSNTILDWLHRTWDAA